MFGSFLRARAPRPVKLTAGVVGPVCFALAACGYSHSVTQVETQSPLANTPPRLAGSAPSRAAAGVEYAFEPRAMDPDGDALRFTVAAKPRWARFDAATGRLSGTPTPADAGLHRGIVITVTDGAATVSLPPFSIEVAFANAQAGPSPSRPVDTGNATHAPESAHSAMATGSASLSWLPPIETVDGSPFLGLSGYRIDYGQNASLVQSIHIENPGVTRFLVENLSPGKWYFRVVAVDAAGVESRPTHIGTKIIH